MDQRQPIHEIHLIQQHLRRAGELADRQPAAAMEHVQAALQLDPSNLAALALRDRLSLAPEFHTGSLREFEQRIRQRRFDALLAETRSAILTNDIEAARAAFDEAAQLCPGAPALAELEAHLAPSSDAAQQTGNIWLRAATGVLLLVVGVSLMIGLERRRWSTTSAISSPEPAVVERQVPDANGSVTERAIDPGERAPDAEPAGSDAAAPVVRAASVSSPPPPSGIESAPRVRRDVGSVRQRSGDPPARADTSRAGAVSIDEEPPGDDRGRPSDDGRRLSPPAGAIPEAPRSSVSPADAPLPAFRSGSAIGNASHPTSVPNASPSPREGFDEGPAAVDVLDVDARQVTDVLQRYARAYSQLDASAARDVWPSVDERALARAFASLASQRVTLQDCRIDVRGTTASASCQGQVSFVGKVGGGEQRTESRDWHFELRRNGERWQIERAEARPAPSRASSQ